MDTSPYLQPNDFVYAGKLVLHDQFRHISSFLYYISQFNLARINTKLRFETISKVLRTTHFECIETPWLHKARKLEAS